MASVDDGAAFARAVGHALRVERLRRGWTMKEMGAPIGLSASGLCRFELGTRPVDMNRLVELCAVLGVAPAQVIAVAQADAFPLDWPVPNAPEQGTVIEACEAGHDNAAGELPGTGRCAVAAPASGAEVKGDGPE
jgi:transcriptional regulator with XRE-family HTH domain